MHVRLAVTATLAAVLCGGAAAGPEGASSKGMGGRARTQSQAAPASLWTERLLATVPKGLSPQSDLWDRWVSVTPDLSTIAYAVRFRSGGQRREAVVVGSQCGPEFDTAGFVALSPDGSRLAHIGVTTEPGLPGFLMLPPSSRIQIQSLDHTLGPGWLPVFSPDGRKLAFMAERPGRTHRIGIIAFPEGSGPIGEDSVVWGPDVRNWDLPVWSPDSSHVVYAAQGPQGDWMIVTDTESGPVFPDATGVTFRGDGLPAFKAKEGGKWFVVSGRERQPRFDEVTAPLFRADGTLVYGASEGGKHLVVIGESRRELPHAPEWGPDPAVVASADGQRVTCWRREGEVGRKRRLVVDGQPGEYFERVTVPSIDPETGAYAYTAEKRNKFYVVTPKGVSPAYDGVSSRPRISGDGRFAAYVALVNDKLWWKVVQLR